MLIQPITSNHNRVEKRIHTHLCGVDWVKGKTKPNYLSVMGNKLNMIDLFAGCGGLSLGTFEAAIQHHRQPQIRLAVDICEKTLEVYRNNFSVNEQTALSVDITKIYDGDLGQRLTLNEARVKKDARTVDIIVAGPPCQGHSNLNNITRRDDPRNLLYNRVIRAAEVHAPRAIVIENVPMIVHDKTGAVTSSDDYLERLGYTISSVVINSHRIGIPQIRKRYILVATKGKKFDIKEEYKTLDGKEFNLRDYIYDIQEEPECRSGIYYTPSAMKEANQKRVNFLFDNDLYDLPNHVRPDCHKYKEHTYYSMYGRLNWDKPSRTITSGFSSMGQGRFVHPSKRRTLTPHEAARIQGFPDFFDFSLSGTRKNLHKMIGNAVPPQVSAFIVDRLFAASIL